MKKFFYQKGSLMIEAIVAISIVTIIILGSMTVAQKSLQISQRSLTHTQANFLLEEGAEAVRIIRDDNWNNISNLALNADFYLVFNSGTWSLNSTPNTIDQFTRKVQLASVYRDASTGSISSGGNLDSGAKLITITVSWHESGILISKNLQFYLMDIF